MDNPKGPQLSGWEPEKNRFSHCQCKAGTVSQRYANDVFIVLFIRRRMKDALFQIGTERLFIIAAVETGLALSAVPGNAAMRVKHAVPSPQTKVERRIAGVERRLEKCPSPKAWRMSLIGMHATVPRLLASEQA
ncbi:MAG: hypothetical protein EOR33_28205 [Mesorhizobium sp.]|uniref:hypothetical protein n=1 Tax=Mesorhizobium sp. TaxID=1871066 RepID=UPI000FE36998|nr:hypothetical protein [Mesorhizobium sp.]RWI83741.1 MAG: hypothetical protein EOR20_20065 [Mesorhizobium sp.]RWJ60790.1 MAG: hypothetical protein EOR33_28205 [Mesorhizobium sp.]